MTVTSAQTWDAVSVIYAEGDMGADSKVYVTLNLGYDATRAGGKVYGQGRGFIAGWLGVRKVHQVAGR